jgi:hypothetical protein
VVGSAALQEQVLATASASATFIHNIDLIYEYIIVILCCGAKLLGSVYAKIKLLQGTRSAKLYPRAGKGEVYLGSLTRMNLL